MSAIPLKDSKVSDTRNLEGLSSQERSRIHVPTVDLLDNPFGVGRQLEDQHQQQLLISRPYVLYAEKEKSAKKLKEEYLNGRAGKRISRTIDAVSIRSKLVQGIVRDTLGPNLDFALPPTLLEPNVCRQERRMNFPDYEGGLCVDPPVSFGHRPNSASRTVDSFDFSLTKPVNNSSSHKKIQNSLISSNVFKLILSAPAASSIIPPQKSTTSSGLVFASDTIEYKDYDDNDENLEHDEKDNWCYNNIPIRVPSHELKQSAIIDSVAHDDDYLKSVLVSNMKRSAGTFSNFTMCEDKLKMDLHDSRMRSDAEYFKRYVQDKAEKEKKRIRMKNKCMSPRSRQIDSEIRDIMKRSKKREEKEWRLTLIAARNQKIDAADRQVERIMNRGSRKSLGDERVVKLPI